MDSNPPLPYHLSPALSINDGAPFLFPGDYVLVRIPIPIDLEPSGNAAGDTDVGSTTSLPPTSAGRSPEHFAFVCNASVLPNNSIELEVYPQLSFARSGGALNGYNNLNDVMRATLIPLLPLSLRHPTPDAFGAPLTVGGWSNSRDAWLRVIPMKLILPFARPFKRMIPPVALSLLELSRIAQYRVTLGATTIGSGQGPSGSGSGSGGRMGEGGSGQGTSGFGSKFRGRSWSSVKNFGKWKIGGEEQQGSKISIPSDNLSTHESSKMDAEGDTTTWKEQLILFASYDDEVGSWKKELAKFLEAERKEQEEVEKERMVRLGEWRQTLATT